MTETKKIGLPSWAEELRERFSSGAVSQFIIYGNVLDLVPYEPPGQPPRFIPLRQFLEEIMLGGYDTVIWYDRGKGIRVTRGSQGWSEWLESLWTSVGPLGPHPTVRDPSRALDLIDLYLVRALNLHALRQMQPKPPIASPSSVVSTSLPSTSHAPPSAAAGASRFKAAVILDFAQFIVPRGDPLYLPGETASNVLKVLSWASDPAIRNSNIVTILIAERLGDLNSLIVDNPHSAKIEIKLPDEEQMRRYLAWLKMGPYPTIEDRSEVGLDVAARRLSGLSRVEAQSVIATALAGREGKITAKLLADLKKEIIEKECQDLLEFLESPFNLDFVAGNNHVKEWLRQDCRLLRLGKLHALPMGYLVAGRIGTGKTFLVQCWAGELGVPCVVFKNFRDKWVGATEGNLEKIFSILQALGQVVVFVDEADQMTGRRGEGSSDSGLSGRVYAMLAKQMSDTRNRGKIIWVFATSRPDLLEVDLKRQGRLDVHIPLFPPQSQEEYRQLFTVVAKKLGFPLKAEDVPTIPDGVEFGGHEIEGILVRALRTYELEMADGGAEIGATSKSKEVCAGEKRMEESCGRRTLSDILKQLISQVKPSAHTKKLEYMDLVAVRECTDALFLPPKYRGMTPEELELRIESLRKFV